MRVFFPLSSLSEACPAGTRLPEGCEKTPAPSPRLCSFREQLEAPGRHSVTRGLQEDAGPEPRATQHRHSPISTPATRLRKEILWIGTQSQASQSQHNNL